ncbi:ATP-binding protein, partial [Streptomyces sp. NPDC048710]|uniref:ATP-binding protein n=1 Tax=Streptomyces sp. NPDC048710 TaxID=3365586 RepID=UPI00372362FE
EVFLTVGDNGVGIPSGGRRSGLRNMAERAEQLGGHLAVSSPEGGGATLEWRVPLPAQ